MEWPTILTAITSQNDLTTEQAQWAMSEIMSGNASAAQIAAFGVALKMKGPSPAEVRALADVMLSLTADVPYSGRAVDIVGTGGDRSHSVNISTMSAIVVAAAGIPVLKHGNRAASSKAGGADTLEALGVAIGLSGPGVARTVNEVGIGFCLASVFHAGLRHAGPPRKEIGIPTVFNVLGPLTNPAQPTSGLIGCAFADLAPVLAQAFADRSSGEHQISDHVIVVRGDDGLDELTTTTTSTVWRVQETGVGVESVDPSALGIERVTREALRGGDAADNARIAREFFGGKSGPVRDAVLLNSAAAVAAYEGLIPGQSVEDNVAAHLPRVAHAVDSGAATALLDRWIAASTAIAGQ